jgi:hypothetical protein
VEIRAGRALSFAERKECKKVMAVLVLAGIGLLVAWGVVFSINYFARAW